MIKHEYIHEGTFEFEAGGSIEGLHVAYHTSERPWQYDDERKVIWICHALTANSDPEEWWPELVGPGKLFDTEKYFVVCVIRRTIGIACSVKCSAWLAAYNESMRMAMEADPTFRECASLKGGEAGLRCARSIALISYRSYQGYNLKQSEPDVDFMFAQRAGSYQRYQGKKLSDRFDAYSYYYLCASADSNNIGRGRGGVDAALGTIRSESILIGIDSDQLFPVCEQKHIASCIPGAVYHEITSEFGHDGFLLENDQLTAIIEPLLP